ncbi:hypothetical protein F5B22DRAFT_612707 [Xylaria bambusicola]|uniref:uncharacterized protein n=1 Tax=Xylaria bambusicola TaxID=326684 RepID=UPI002007FF8D|nr:uncharacterized protein F5B22DRAFT_612707 [Xylaria bambusicola]KAI0513213.1 hypothetical protein F5B22DRAFT_612707 [Xylaria bambusicola]
MRNAVRIGVLRSVCLLLLMLLMFLIIISNGREGWEGTGREEKRNLQRRMRRRSCSPRRRRHRTWDSMSYAYLLVVVDVVCWLFVRQERSVM